MRMHKATIPKTTFFELGVCITVYKRILMFWEHSTCFDTLACKKNCFGNSLTIFILTTVVHTNEIYIQLKVTFRDLSYIE